MTATTDFEEQLETFREEVEQRCAKLKDTHTLKGLFLSTYLEAWGQAGGPALRERCAAALGEPTIHALLGYPYARVLRMGLIAAEQLGAQAGGIEPFLRGMGRVATDGYLRSALGQAFLAMLPSRPRSMVKLMPWAIRSTFNFGERSMHFEGPTAGTFRCRYDFSPAQANAGAVEAALVAAGAKDVRVEVESFDLYNFDLKLTWAE